MRGVGFGPAAQVGAHLLRRGGRGPRPPGEPRRALVRSVSVSRRTVGVRAPPRCSASSNDEPSAVPRTTRRAPAATRGGLQAADSSTAWNGVQPAPTATPTRSTAIGQLGHQPRRRRGGRAGVAPGAPSTRSDHRDRRPAIEPDRRWRGTRDRRRAASAAIARRAASRRAIRRATAEHRGSPRARPTRARARSRSRRRSRCGRSGASTRRRATSSASPATAHDAPGVGAEQARANAGGRRSSDHPRYTSGAIPTTSAEYRAWAESARASARPPSRSRSDVARPSSASADAAADWRVRHGQRAGGGVDTGRGPLAGPRSQRVGERRAELDAGFARARSLASGPSTVPQPGDRGRDGAARRGARRRHARARRGTAAVDRAAAAMPERVERPAARRTRPRRLRRAASVHAERDADDRDDQRRRESPTSGRPAPGVDVDRRVVERPRRARGSQPRRQAHDAVRRLAGGRARRTAAPARGEPRRSHRAARRAIDERRHAHHASAEVDTGATGAVARAVHATTSRAVDAGQQRARTHAPGRDRPRRPRRSRAVRRARAPTCTIASMAAASWARTAAQRQRDPAEQRERLEPRERVGRAVGVHRRQRAVVTGVAAPAACRGPRRRGPRRRSRRSGRMRSAVRTSSRTLTAPAPSALAGALRAARRAAAEPELGRLLDRDDALSRVDGPRQRVAERRLARARCARRRRGSIRARTGFDELAAARVDGRRRRARRVASRSGGSSGTVRRARAAATPRAAGSRRRGGRRRSARRGRVAGRAARSTRSARRARSSSASIAQSTRSDPAAPLDEGTRPDRSP